MVRRENPNACPHEMSGGVRQVEFSTVNDKQFSASYIETNVGVTIASEHARDGAVSINGPERLKAARDCLIEACEHFGIE